MQRTLCDHLPRTWPNNDRWKALLRNTFVELRAAQIEADLMVVSPAAAAFFNDPEIRRVLRIATRVRSVTDLSEQDGRHRTKLTRNFQRRLGRAPKDLLALF